MKFKAFLIVMAAAFVLEIAAAAVYLSAQPDFTQDTVLVNEIVETVRACWGDLREESLPNSADYTVVDGEGNVLYRKGKGAETYGQAVANRDTVAEITLQGVSVGRVYIRNDTAERFAARRRPAAIALLCGICAQGIVCLVYAAYLLWAVFSPFKRLKGFAVRVAGGDLDMPLTMDRHNAFGAFTEAFDIMRAELRKAREAEAAANQSKKELVAKLSHDIKTPVASIKAVSELGRIRSASEKDRDNFAVIEDKADRIDMLVENLFQASLEELQQLSVVPSDHPSAMIKKLIERADYRSCAPPAPIPECLLRFDPLRLQQVFDNIVSNSYKYAETPLVVSFTLAGRLLRVRLEDFGGGVDPVELPLLKGKYNRGKNAAGKEGAGLGLYIADCLMRSMGGTLETENTDKGFAVTVGIPISGK